MNSKSKYAVLLLSSVFVAYAIIGGMLGRVNAQNGSYAHLDVFMDVFRYIQNDYVDEPSLSLAVTGAIRGLIERVDPNGGFLSPQDVTFYKNFDYLKTPGIGAVLARPVDSRGEVLGYPAIVSVFPGSPAEKAELTTGDIIEAIDGITTREMNLVQVHAFLANPPDKPVSLTVIRRRTAEPEVLSLNREIPKAPPVESKLVDNDIAYIRVPFLAAGKAAETRRHLDDLLKKGATSIILDLRQTAGGQEREGIALANLFLEAGVIGYLEGQKVQREFFQANKEGALTAAPLAVLINSGTSGPAEIVAGAIADNNRGQILGTRTLGSASVQTLIEMGNGNALLMATAKYYTPSGKEIQSTGIRPTVEVSAVDEELIPTTEEELEILPAPRPTGQPDEDRQLNKAIEILKQGKAARVAA